MSARSRWNAGVVLLVVAGCQVNQDDIAASGHVDYWRPNVVGHASITKASRAGTATTMSLRRDGGLEHDNVPAAGLDVDLDRARISFEYVDISVHGNSDATTGFLFHGQTYANGDRISTELKNPTSSLSWSYALWRDRASVWRAGVGARMWTFDLKVRDATAGFEESRRFTHVYPLVTSDASFDLGGDFVAIVRGNLATTSRRQVIVDGAAAVGYGAGRWRSELGWRFLRLDWNESTNDADFNLSGPYLSFRITF